MQQDWEVLERVFSEALELPPAERLRFVREQSGDNLWLRKELESLLEVPERKSDAAFDAGTGIVRELLSALDTEYAVGREIGGYRIESLISSGGMGVVYKAAHLTTGEMVAIKLLPPEDSGNPRRIRRMAREAEVLAKLRHPGIVLLKDYQWQAGRHFLVMDLVAGETLRTVLAEGPISLGQVLDWGAQIAAAAEAAHALGVVHRDLKPANIMIETATGRVKLLDFGLARMVIEGTQTHTATTVEGTLAGTFSYFSPEQAQGGRGDERSDIFSFGAVLYEMIARRRAFDRPGAVATAAAVLTECPDALPDEVPFRLTALVERCLRKDPARRFASMTEVRYGIEHLLELHSQGRLKPPLRRKVRFAAVIAGGLATTVALGWLVGVRTPVARAEPSLAVLPFVNRSTAPASQYLSVGLTEEIADALGRIGTLRVTTPSSAKQISGKTADSREAGRLLHVSNVLEGSVERVNDRVHVVARLERVTDGALLWSNTYETRESELAKIQLDLEEGVAVSLKLMRTNRAATHVPQSEAHDYLLKARYEGEQMTPDAQRQAEADLQRAIDLDPAYPAAYCNLAVTRYNQSVARGSTPQTGEERRDVEELLHKALGLDPGLPAAHALLAILSMQYRWDWTGAERELREAASGADAKIEEYSAFLALFHGRFPEADVHIRRAQDMDPFSTASMGNLALFRSLEGRFAEAREMAQRLSALYPRVLSPKVLLFLVNVEEGKTDLALRELEQWKSGFVGAPLFEAMAYARAGRREEALRLIRPLEEKYPNPGVTLQWFALVYGFLGDEPNTVKWLERSANEHEWQALNLAVNPVFAPMRHSPRFQALEKLMGLPQ